MVTAVPEHIYKSSPFWSALADAAEVCALVWPFVLVAACLLWVWRTRSTWAVCGVLASVLVLAAHLMHQFRAGVEFLSLGKELQPLAGVEALPFVVFVYGQHLGLALLSVAILGHFAAKHAPRS